MKVIIAGSRFSESDVDYELLCKAITASGFEVTEVVSGAASGIDKLGEFYAEERGLPVTKYPAHWAANGKAAGPIRNGLMAHYSDALVALPRGSSLGTRNMIRQMQALGKPVFVVEL